MSKIRENINFVFLYLDQCQLSPSIYLISYLILILLTIDRVNVKCFEGVYINFKNKATDCDKTLTLEYANSYQIDTLTPSFLQCNAMFFSREGLLF